VRIYDYFPALKKGGRINKKEYKALGRALDSSRLLASIPIFETDNLK
jgi:hypothetical protein